MSEETEWQNLLNLIAYGIEGVIAMQKKGERDEQRL